jgi:DNA polymerase family A
MFAPFQEIWASDSEFAQPPGCRPMPHCVVARELRSDRVIRRWVGASGSSTSTEPAPPPLISPDALTITYFGAAEVCSYLALGWPLPANHVDLYAEFRVLANGSRWDGYGLNDALRYFGLESMASAHKEEMRKLAIRGGPFSENEKVALLDYCQEDVDATAKLARAMCPRIDLPRALIRGRYINTVGLMQWAGVPVDAELLAHLRENWTAITDSLIARVDRDYGVYENRSFRRARWGQWLQSHGINWPRLPTGVLALDYDTFREMARCHPEVVPMKELRATLAKLRIHDLPVGPDGRNRTLLSPFGSRTGRNQPKTSEFIFGPAKWVRGLIRPEPGKALGYLDFAHQEFAIGAALSGDTKMQSAYQSGDPYLAFAKQAGAVPVDATRQTHAAQRELFKTCTLGLQYLMGAHTLARRTRLSIAHAEELIELHRRTYSNYWRWSEGAQDYAMMNGELTAAFGWRVRVQDATNDRFVRNFLLQANGAEMLRLACILATERGVTICAPVHDALLIEAHADAIEHHVAICESAMRKAGEIVLNGFALRVESRILRHAERLLAPSAAKIWNQVNGILAGILNDKAGQMSPAGTGDVSQ